MPVLVATMFRTLLLCLLLLATRTVHAAFTRSAHWKLDQVDLTYAGTPCFRPGPNSITARACSNSTLSSLLNAHVNNERGPGLSIAYYDIKDGTVLGGASWDEWDAVALPVGVCMSGMVGGLDIYSTTCRFAVVNDDHDLASAHITECTVSRPQLRVTDGCYTPPPRTTAFRLNDTASATLTILGLLFVLPGMIFGAYRWYSARQASQRVGVEEVGIVLPGVVGSGRVPPSQNLPLPQPTLYET